MEKSEEEENFTGTSLLAKQSARVDDGIGVGGDEDFVVVEDVVEPVQVPYFDWQPVPQ